MAVMDNPNFEVAWGHASWDKEFPLMADMLMPKNKWDLVALNDWAERVKSWRTSILDKENFFGDTVEIPTGKVVETRELFFDAMSAIGAGEQIIRDNGQEAEAFDRSYTNFFPDGSTYIGTNQVHEMYGSLVVRPAGELGRYAVAMGRLISEGRETL